MEDHVAPGVSKVRGEAQGLRLHQKRQTQGDIGPGSVVVMGRALFPVKTVTLGFWSGLSKPTRGRGPGRPWGTDSHLVSVDQSGPPPTPGHSAVA